MYKVIYSGEHPVHTDWWEVHIQREDGAKGTHLMPKFTLDMRAAEYGIEPTDVDTLMAIILHEVYMPVDEPTAETLTPHPPLFRADSTTQAKTEVMARIKNCRVQFEVKGSKGLDAIRAGHKPDLDRVKAHREVVDTHRWEVKYGDLPRPPRHPEKPVVGQPFVITGMKESGANPLPDSMINDGSITIRVKGSNG